MTRTAPALDRRALVARILALQDRDGRIRWIDGGLWDPWNHVEAAMGLTVGGETAAATRALDYLAETQQDDGGWTADMGCAAELSADGRRIEPAAPTIRDTNFAAYAAVGLWHLAQATGSTALLKRHARLIARGLDFALAHQRADGALAWRTQEPSETVEDVEALVAGSCSIFKSLECGVRIFEALDLPTDAWRAARARLGRALRSGEARWAPKPEFAMDWYYPALTGVLAREDARRRLAREWPRFVDNTWGCLCVAGEPWATAAETAELAIALAAAGSPRLGARVLNAAARMRTPEGDAWMGWQFRENRPWPEEHPSWTAGAILIADDVLRGASPTARVFLDTLPETPTSGASAETASRSE